MTTTAKKGGIGFKRWIILALMIAGGVLNWGVGGVFKIVSPAVVIPGERIWLSLPDFFNLGPFFSFTLTNTVLATLLTDVVLLGIAFSAYRFVKSGKPVPDGMYNAFEALVEFLWSATEAAAGKWSRAIFPFMATIFFLVFTANMVKLMPGFESIGYMKEAHGNIQGYKEAKLIPGVLWAIDGAHPVDHTTDTHEEDPSHETPVEEPHGGAASDVAHKRLTAEGAELEYCKEACEVVPFLRGSATDLNFTFALAIIAVVMTQVFGVSALKINYFEKFINVRGLISKPGFGVIDFGVGLLELISEFSKILSFSFRLFGNIFAGALLLSILGALTAVALPVGLYLFEMFFGAIQAYVFAMLALVFMSQATVSHHGDDHGHDNAHGAAAEAHH